MAQIKALLLAGAALVMLMIAAPSYVAGAGNGSLSVAPATQNIGSGIGPHNGLPGNPTVFQVAVHQNVNVSTLGIQTNLAFDQTLIKIDSVAMGDAYTSPDAQSLVAGVAPQTVSDAITEANTTGLLKNLAVAFSDSSAGTVASGDAESIVITMETLPLAVGTSALTLSSSEIIDTNGDPSTVGSPTNGSVTLALKNDADGDGCPNAKEQQVAPGTEVSGGRRDYTNAYDYFNPTHDHQNRVDDIIKVVGQYFKDDNDGSPGVPPFALNYNPDTDRTALGPNGWNLGAGNGQQRVDDILAQIKQYFHDCS